MRTFTQKQNQPQQRASSNITRSNTVSPAASLQADLILHLQRTIGNQAVQRLLQANPDDLEARSSTNEVMCEANVFSQIPVHPKSLASIQARLTVSSPGHPYEQEADRVSGQVMRMSEPQLQRACACDGGCPECRTEQPDQELERLQTKRIRASNTGEIAAPPIVHDVLASPGHPLDAATRSFMEPRFGHDFSRVRVHTDARAAESAWAVDALAYTVGRNVVFGAGQYVPASSAGQRLLAHELTHVVQQNCLGVPERHERLWFVPESDAMEREARATAQSSLAGGVSRMARGPSRAQLQRQPSGAGNAATQEQAIAEFEADRRRFEQAQEEHFESIGEIVREHLLKAAGFVGGKRPTTPDEALTVIGMWGLTLQMLTTQLPHLSQSISGQVVGQHPSTTVAQQQQTLIAALTAQGQQTFQQMLTTVRSEPFWKQHLDTQDIFIFPDLTGTNRYTGYTQRGTGQTAEGLTKPVFVIHISKDRLEAGQIEESVAILIHELSHTLYEPTLVQRSLKSFTNSLAELLADHPTIAAMRQGAQDAAGARQIHIRRISQILYEHTGYGEAEIFVHLQQLTHQPPVPVGGQTIPGTRFILVQVEAYAEKLRRIGLPPRMLSGILRTLARRVALLYDRRIAAAAQGSNQRRVLELNKEIALEILSLAAGE